MSFEKLSPEVLRQHKGTSFVGITTIFFCHDGNGKVYFTKRSQKARDEQGRWEPGGGGLKFGQSAEDNMRRELMEEYGATAKETIFMGYRDVFRQLPDGTPTHWLGLDYLVRVDPAELSVREPDMIDDAGWFWLDELPEPVHSQIPVFFKRYGDLFDREIRAKAVRQPAD